MTEFYSLRGFEEALRPPVDVRRARISPAVLGKVERHGEGEAAARVARLARRVPEVMVKITGRTRDAGHLKAHLDYISRNGALDLEGPDGERWKGMRDVAGLSRDWAEETAMEPGRRCNSPLSLSIVLSMPAGVEPMRVRDAARAFAVAAFGDRFAYVFALHDEGRHPHVHLTVRALGREGERLNPRKADLQAWREGFARALRDRGVEAEATPRRARAVTRKAERGPVRRMRERYLAGPGPLPRVLEAAYRQALRDDVRPTPWRAAIRARERAIRRALVAESLRLQRSGKVEDRVLGALVEEFTRSRGEPETREEALIRQQKDRSRGDGMSRER